MGNAGSLPSPIKGVKFLEVIGEGSFGKVYKAEWKGQNVAVKQLKRHQFRHEDITSRFRVECQTLRGLEHRNIVKMFKVIEPGGEIPPILILELLHCDLETYLARNTKPIPLQKVVNIMLDVAEALQYLQNKRYPIAHRDLASKNILLTSNEQAKIADLGLAKVLVCDMEASGTPGHRPYAAPETFPSKTGPHGIFLKPKYDARVDVFSFGVLLLEVITGNPPKPYPPDGPVNYEGEFIPEIQRRNKDIDQMGTGHRLADIVLDCLENDREKRPTTQRIVERLNLEKEKIDQKVKIASSGRAKLKVLALGASGVGKTCILKRFKYSQFDVDEPSTVGADLLWTDVSYNGIAFHLEMTDPSGQEQFFSVIPSQLRDSDAVLFVFDINKSKTLEKDIPTFIQLYSLQYGCEPSTVLVGNKVDRSGKGAGAKRQIYEVTEKRAQAFADKHHMPYIETSAKTGHNIECLFEMVVQMVYERLELGDIQDYLHSRPGSSKIKLIPNEPKKSSCAC